MRSLLNIKLSITISIAATAKFEIIDRTNPNGDIVNVIIDEKANPLPRSGIAYSPIADEVVNIETKPKRIITISSGAINELASFTLFEYADTIEKAEIITSTTETIRARNIK